MQRRVPDPRVRCNNTLSHERLVRAVRIGILLVKRMVRGAGAVPEAEGDAVSLARRGRPCSCPAPRGSPPQRHERLIRAPVARAVRNHLAYTTN